MARRRLFTGLLAAGIFAGAAVSFADIIELRDGRKINGNISRRGDAMVIRGDDGQTLTVNPNDVQRVTLTSNLSPQEAAAAEWTRIALEIKKADDLQSIVALHEKFLQKFPEVPLAADVKASLGVYQQLASSGGVKFRGRWLPKAQIDVMLKQWADEAKPATDLYKRGQLREALDTARIALMKDDQNPDALAIAGLASYRANNLGQARTFFASLASADPGSVLAENNLAVICFLQHASGEGLLHYTRALQAMPDNRLVLDNIAEALNSYLTGGGDKNGNACRTLMRQFEPAETRVEAEMLKKGLKRWGSTWVAGDQLDQLVKYQQIVQDRMAQMDSQYKVAQETLAAIDAQIKQSQLDYESYLGNVDYYNSQIIQLQQRAIDTVYVTAQRDAAQAALDHVQQHKSALQTQRAQLIAGLEEERAQAEKLKTTVGTGRVAQYTGNQRIMDLGEAENPPPPAPVAMPPALPAAPIVVVQPPAQQPQDPVPLNPQTQMPPGPPVMAPH